MSVGDGDGYLASYTPSGNRVWITQFGTAQDDILSDVAWVGEALFVAGRVAPSSSSQSDGTVQRVCD